MVRRLITKRRGFSMSNDYSPATSHPMTDVDSDYYQDDYLDEEMDLGKSDSSDSESDHVGIDGNGGVDDGQIYESDGSSDLNITSDLEEECDPGSDSNFDFSSLKDDFLLKLCFAYDSCLSGVDWERYLLSSVSDRSEQRILRKLYNDCKNAACVTKENYCFTCCSPLRATDQVASCCGDGPVFSWLSCDVAQQLQLIVNREYNNIVQVYRLMERGMSTNSLLDSKWFRSFAQLQDVTTTCPAHFLLHFDGVRMEGTKKKLWPMFGQYVDLPHARRILLRNLVCFGVFSSDRDPTALVHNFILLKIEKLLDSLAAILKVSREGPEVGVSASIVGGTYDRPAKAVVYDFAFHSSRHSCWYCLTEDTVYKATQGKDRCSERHENLTITDAEYGQYGFKATCEPEMNKICLVYNSTMDHLHVVLEGVMKALLKESAPWLFNSKKTKNINSYFSLNTGVAGRQSKITHFLRSIALPTGFPTFDSNSLSLASGGTIQSVFVYGLTSLAMNNEFQRPICSVLIMGISLVDLLLHNKDYDQKELDQVKRIMPMLATLYRIALHNRLPFKAHEWLYHLTHVLENVGNIVDTSTALAESCHHYLKANINSYVTNGRIQQMLVRWFAWRNLRDELVRRAETSDSMSDPIVRYMKTIGRGTLTLKCVKVDKSAVAFEEVEKLGYDLSDCYSKMALNNVVYLSLAWSRSRRCADHYVVFTESGVKHFGIIHFMFVGTYGSIHFVVTPLVVDHSSLDVLINQFTDGSDCSIAALGLLQEFKLSTCFAAGHFNGRMCCVHENSILGKAAFIEGTNFNIAFDVNFRPFHR